MYPLLIYVILKSAIKKYFFFAILFLHLLTFKTPILTYKIDFKNV